MGDNAARTMSDNLMPIIITTPATTNDSETASTSEGDEATFTQGHNDLTAISPKCDNKVTSPNDSTSSNVGGAEVKGSDATKHRLHMLKADNTQMAVHAASLPEGLAGHSLDTTIPDGIHEEDAVDDSSDYGSDDDDETPVDPRVEGVLVAMTDAMEDVNINENLYNRAKKQYSDAIQDGDRKLREVLRRTGVRSAVNKTTDYFNSWQLLRQRLEDARTATTQYEEAQNQLEEAKKREAACETAMLQELRSTTSLDTTNTDDEGSHTPGLLSHATQVKLNDATNEVNKCKAKVEKQGRLVAATTQKVKTAQDKFQDLRQKATYDPIYGVRVDRAQQYFQVKTQVQDNIGALQADLSNKYLTVEQSRTIYKQTTQNIEALTMEIQSARATPCGSPAPPNSQKNNSSSK